MVTSGDVIVVITIDWIDDYSTVRQSVDTFKTEEEAKAVLKAFDEEAGALVKKNNPNWEREGDGETFVEYGKPGNYYDSHAVAKITKCVVH